MGGQEIFERLKIELRLKNARIPSIEVWLALANHGLWFRPIGRNLPFFCFVVMAKKRKQFKSWVFLQRFLTNHCSRLVDSKHGRGRVMMWINFSISSMRRKGVVAGDLALFGSVFPTFLPDHPLFFDRTFRNVNPRVTGYVKHPSDVSIRWVVVIRPLFIPFGWRNLTGLGLGVCRLVIFPILSSNYEIFLFFTFVDVIMT